MKRLNKIIIFLFSILKNTFVLIFAFILYILYKNNKEFFYSSGRQVYTNHNGGNKCKYISTRSNQDGFSCCTKFEDEEKYKNKCCIEVKNNICKKWQGSY